MTLQTWKQLTCDWCGVADHFQGSNNNVNRQAKDLGYIIKGTKHFCGEDCQQAYIKKANTPTTKQ